MMKYLGKKGNLLSFKNKKYNNGITLIALVITIIVLLILAAVTINTLTGENGIITRASQASEQTKQANAEEQVELAVATSIGKDGNINIDTLNDELEKIGVYYNENPISSTNRIESLPADVVLDGHTITIDADGSTGSNTGGENTETGETVVDSVTIPEGFYHIEGTTVTEGLLISDVEGDDLNNSAGGNQYVWIPVDGILGEDGDINDVKNNGKILLGRYEFDEDGTPLEYSGDYTEENSRNIEDLLNYGNTIANDIEDFIDSVRNNGGYYIARFEASQGTDNKVESKYNKTVWSYITQSNAAIACQDLYTGINSDLMNSYAWDTAILFIQKYGQSNYSRQGGRSINSSIQTTGLSGDVQMNIYDMAGNCYEWTTETSKYSNFPCVLRGGIYVTDNVYVCERNIDTTSASNGLYSFRSLLYL